jgi:hypothetical protein
MLCYTHSHKYPNLLKKPEFRPIASKALVVGLDNKLSGFNKAEMNGL